MKRTGYEHKNLSTLPWFHWGLNVEGAKEFFFVTGQCDYDKDSVTKHMNDPVGQARHILQQMEETYAQAGYTRDNIIKINWCVTKDVTEVQTTEILDVWADFIKDNEVKPMGGTWKRIHGLIHPNMMVELEVVLAR
ncbi:Rid family hydrolase [Roseovarius sp. EL26]|uniref:Rid family hydrolase n=1 Tax=Roseovarius sp. EL26 TaxID=2126672 RepID=UPI000EA382BC|nr:Rid family hydrolase [Roseovarius sp. EL26]